MASFFKPLLLAFSTAYVLAFPLASSAQNIPKQKAVRKIPITHVSTASDAYIVDFINLSEDKALIKVDFIVLKENQHNGFDVINNNPKLRTFILDKPFYKSCSAEKTSVTEIQTHWEAVTWNVPKNKHPIYWVRTRDGVVTELFYRECAG